MIGRIIDITKWDAAKRSALYRLTRDQTEFALILGREIGADGTVELMIAAAMRATPWQVRAKYGEGIGEFQFITPDPEVEGLLEIFTGKVKPGAPLPDVSEKGLPDGKNGSDELDPLDVEPSRFTRKTAVKNTRL